MWFTQAEDIFMMQFWQHKRHYITHGGQAFQGMPDGIMICGDTRNMLPSDPAAWIARLVIIFIAFPIHEFAHAWTATRFGDDTPRLMGRLTLNPLAHIDVMGALLVIVVGFGWAKPVQVDPYALQRRSHSAMMWVSLAGPFSNLALAILAAIPFRLGLASVAAIYNPLSSTEVQGFVSRILADFILINLLLMLFNLIPLAPLDGEKVLDFFLPPNLAKVMDQIRPYGPMILIVLVLVGPYVGLDIIGRIIMPPLQALFGFLVG
jgi:Zn-dependent protease